MSAQAILSSPYLLYVNVVKQHPSLANIILPIQNNPYGESL